MSPEEFDAFYLRSAPRLVRQLTAMVGSQSEAQDLVQEAFVRAWQRHRSLTADGAPEAWVRTVALRLSVSRWRKERNALFAWTRRADDRPRLIDEPFDPELVAALQQLPEAQRVVIVLHHLADRSVAQVAAELAVPEGTVKARLARGRAALAQLLTPPADQPGQPDRPGQLHQPDRPLPHPASSQSGGAR